MTKKHLFSVSDACKILGIDLKSFRIWRHKAHIVMQMSEVDGRVRLIAYEDIVRLAKLHGRELRSPQEADPKEPTTVQSLKLRIAQLENERLGEDERLATIEALQQQLQEQREQLRTISAQLATRSTKAERQQPFPVNEEEQDSSITQVLPVFDLVSGRALMPKGWLPHTVLAEMHGLPEGTLRSAIKTHRAIGAHRPPGETKGWAYNGLTYQLAMDENGIAWFHRQLGYVRHGCPENCAYKNSHNANYESNRSPDGGETDYIPRSTAISIGIDELFSDRLYHTNADESGEK